MKRKMIAGICLGAAAVLLLGTAGIYAFREVTATYQAGTGKVDIELEERMMADGEKNHGSWKNRCFPVRHCHGLQGSGIRLPTVMCVRLLHFRMGPVWKKGLPIRICSECPETG